MLCERCHEREATVHVTGVDDVSSSTTQHEFCESCFQQTEPALAFGLEGCTSYDYTEPNE